jgi:ankyrin repeat protein
VDVLLDEGADVNWVAVDGATPLHVAAALGNECVATRLLQNPLVEKERRLDSSGFTALHLAVTSGNGGTVAALLKAGASFDHAACKGITPLHLAADLGLESIVEQLLNSHLDFSHNESPTALHFACRVPCFDTVAPALQVLCL